MTQYEIPVESKKKKSARIPINKLHDFDGHPYKVTDNEDMDKLVESIKLQGIITPLIVRQKDNATNEYEVISGHRRLHASKRAGLTEVPALIYPYTKTEAAIAVVDSNLHRERILPSEKAFAYKMKMEALKEQGKRTDLTSSQVATKSDTATEIGKAANESRDQVFRYIRLTNLIPELLQLVDEERIALTPAVELSYLTEQEQYDLMSIIESEDCTPSLSQSIRLKKLSQTGQLNADKIFAVLSEEKANQKERISFPFEDVSRFFPKSYTPKDVYNAILKLIGEDYQRRERARKNRDERQEKNMKFICGLAQQENEYVINGVKYIVGSSFMTSKIGNHPTITDRFKRIVTSDFVPLTDESPPSKMAVEYVCSTAGKED